VTRSDKEGVGFGTNENRWTKVFAHHNEDSAALKPDTIYFDFDSATIKKSEDKKLEEVAKFLTSHLDDALRVEGNCDERGTEKYNLSLGERRALAAREYLANLGVDPHQIDTVTYGKSKPAVQGHNEAAWSKNRRDDFVVLTPKAPE
jgi:peptidoglycan-associated lipoprotein